MLFNFSDLTFPIISAAIHDGHKLREELQDYLYIKEKDRLREEDPYTGKWLPISRNTITTEYSRFEVDLNRPKDKAVYLTPDDSWGLKVWKYSLPEDVYYRSQLEYHNFYSELEKNINSLLKQNEVIVVYDLHSYNYKRNGPTQPAEPNSLNPELNLGTGTLNRERWLPIIDRFVGDVESYDFLGRKIDIRENVKFRGGNFPRWLHQKFPESVCCLSIEFRKFFMDEWTGEPYIPIIKEIGKLLELTTLGILEEITKMKSK